MKRGFFLLLLGLTACTRVDNFFLGEDNTEQPAKLTPIKERVLLEREWKVKTGYGQHQEYVSLRPAMLKDRIITADVRGNVTAVDRNTSQIIWKAQLQEGVSSGPVVHNQVIILGTRKGQVLAISAQDGKAIWKSMASNEILARPVVSGNIVLIQSIDAKLYAFNLQTGQLIWRYDHRTPSMILRAGGAPAVSDGKVIAGFPDGRLVAVNLENGQILWIRAVVHPEGGTDVQRMVDIAATPVILGDLLYVATFQGQLTAIQLSTGNIIWQKRLSIYADLAPNGKVLYATDSHSQLWAMDRYSGHVLWKQKALKGRNLTSPVISGNKILVADNSGYVHVLSANNGKIIGRKHVSYLSSIRSAPRVQDQQVYVFLTNGDLERFTLKAAPPPEPKTT